MRISDWSSDVCSSDLRARCHRARCRSGAIWRVRARSLANEESRMSDRKTIADLIEDRFGLPTADGHDMPAAGELASILRHRSHRRFKPEPVPDDLLRVVLAAAFSAPAKSDLQQCSVNVVRDPAIRSRLTVLVESQDWVADDPSMLVLFGYKHTIPRHAGDARQKAKAAV